MHASGISDALNLVQLQRTQLSEFRAHSGAKSPFAMAASEGHDAVRLL